MSTRSQTAPLFGPSEVFSPFFWVPATSRRRSLSQRMVHAVRRLLGVRRTAGHKVEKRTVLQKLGPKRRALLEQNWRALAKRAAGYLLGLGIVAYSLVRACYVLAEHGSETAMVNVLLGIFSGIVILFLISHDKAVDRRQGTL